MSIEPRVAIGTGASQGSGAGDPRYRPVGGPNDQQLDLE
jgi:hypothetical protein